jgi:hypothetical protein
MVAGHGRTVVIRRVEAAAGDLAEFGDQGVDILAGVVKELHLLFSQHWPPSPSRRQMWPELQEW